MGRGTGPACAGERGRWERLRPSAAAAPLRDLERGRCQTPAAFGPLELAGAFVWPIVSAGGSPGPAGGGCPPRRRPQRGSAAARRELPLRSQAALPSASFPAGI